jgi:exopolyphosphatase/guanosine-5'-triphosphate,3'-diphosphate pyrophosphatase
MRLGAIDVGTNSIHLIVVELDPHFGTSRTLLKQREMVRLGAADALAKGHLGRKAVQRGVSAIGRFVEAAHLAGAAEIRVVATSAVREARNRDEFVAAVFNATGVRVEVLSDLEEARLIHLGVSRGYPLDDKVACIIDIGGGSTEFIVADARRPLFLHSERLGSLRLYDAFLRDSSNPKRDLAALEAHVGRTLANVGRQIADYPFDVMIGTSGTIMGLASVDAARAGRDLERVHGYVLRLDRLAEMQSTMIEMSPAERRKLPGMNPRRSDIIVAGCAILMSAMTALGRTELVVCDRALREGVVVDFLERNLALSRALGDVQTRRFDSAHELARRFGAGGVHDNKVASLALQLFDKLPDVHGFEPKEREVLFAAAILHDVGRSISLSSHHKHGAYIVANAGLPNWDDDEVKLIAALVRYHRKSLPKPSHAEWIEADPVMRRRILGLGALLRIADGLDERHLGVVSEVDVARDGETVVLRVSGHDEMEPELDGASFKSDLFERAFGRPVRYEAVAVSPAVSEGDATGDVFDELSSEASAAPIEAASVAPGTAVPSFQNARN